MLDSEVLDIAIGLVFVYFLLSLLALTVAELIARITALRSATLYNAIRNLLTDPTLGDSDLLDEFWKHPLIATLTRKDAGHGLGVGGHKPSYVPANLFVLAILDAIGSQTRPGVTMESHGDVRSALQALTGREAQLGRLFLSIIGVNGDIEQAQKDLEKWFDDYMERVSGWYKRKIQIINLVLGLVLAVLLNADSIAIFNALSVNPDLRTAVVEVAKEYVAANPAPIPTPTTPVPGEEVDLVEPVARILRLEQTLMDLNIPITWANAEVPGDLSAWFSKLLGLLVTALLVSLGAPFWFDLLNRFVNLRSTGKAPPTWDEKPAQGQATPARGNGAVPVVFPPPTQSIDLDALADKAAEFVDNLKARGRLASHAEEDDAAMQYLKSTSTRLGLAVTEGQLSGAWEAAYKPWRN